MSTYLSLILAFSSPNFKKNNKSIKRNSSQNKIIRGFPYQYFEGEILTDEMVERRIRLIYMSSLIYIMISFSVVPAVAPIAGQTIFNSTATSIERVIPNQLNFQTNQQELLRLYFRGGESKRLAIGLLMWLASVTNNVRLAVSLLPIFYSHTTSAQRYPERPAFISSNRHLPRQYRLDNKNPYFFNDNNRNNFYNQ
jgi:hypothetical protein